MKDMLSQQFACALKPAEWWCCSLSFSVEHSLTNCLRRFVSLLWTIDVSVLLVSKFLRGVGGYKLVWSMLKTRGHCKFRCYYVIQLVRAISSEMPQNFTVFQALRFIDSLMPSQSDSSNAWFRCLSTLSNSSSKELYKRPLLVRPLDVVKIFPIIFFLI